MLLVAIVGPCVVVDGRAERPLPRTLRPLLNLVLTFALLRCMRAI